MRQDEQEAEEDRQERALSVIREPEPDRVRRGGSGGVGVSGFASG